MKRGLLTTQRVVCKRGYWLLSLKMRTMDLVANTLLSLFLYKTYFAHAGYTFQGSYKRGRSQPFDVNREFAGPGDCLDHCNDISYCVSFTWSSDSNSCYMHHVTEIDSTTCGCNFYTKDGSVAVASISTTTTENGIEYNILLETTGSSGSFIGGRTFTSSYRCREDCDRTPGCLAVEYSIYSTSCFLYDSRTTSGTSNINYVFYVKVEQEETTVAREATTTVTEMATTTLQDTTALTTDVTTTEEETTFVTEAKTTVTEMITTTLQETTAMTTDITTSEEESSISKTDTVSHVTNDETDTSSAIAVSFDTTTSSYNTADYSTTENPQSVDPEVTSFWMSSSDSISIPAPTVPSSYQTTEYTNSSVPRVECLCNCMETPNRTLEEAIAAITARLTVKKERLSSSTRKLISATDDRYSSEQLGYLGIAMISFVFVFLTFSDLCSIVCFVYKSIRQCVSKT